MSREYQQNDASDNKQKQQQEEDKHLQRWDEMRFGTEAK